MASKPKLTRPVTPNNKASPATPRVSIFSRGGAKPETESPSPSPGQKSRLSVDRSPRPVTPKPNVDRRSPKLGTPPDKQPIRPRTPKGPELQPQLNVIQEDLKNTQDKLVLVEKEKEQAINELKEAQRLAEEANERLMVALAAQKRAEEDSEIEKFRAVEMEYAGIEAAQKKEDEWDREIEAVRNQHAIDVSALISTTQELQKVKQDLAMTHDAKNQALKHADDATRIAEIHAEKAEILSAELVKLRSSLDSRIEAESNEKQKLVAEMKSEVERLKSELEIAKDFEEMLEEKEVFVEELSVELEAARMAESYVRNLLEEWQKRVEELEDRAEESNRLEKSASESLKSVMKQLEGSNDLLCDAKSEISSLKETVGLLEISIITQKRDLEESERRFDIAKEEASRTREKVEGLNSELETLKQEKINALNNEKLACASVETLLEEKNQLLNELEISKDEEEKSKKAMESLASALHEVSSAARETKEKLLFMQTEQESYETKIKDLNLVLKTTNEKYESMLDDEKHEIDALTNLIEQSKLDYENSKAEWEQKELHLMNCVKNYEEENSSMEKEISWLGNSLDVAKEEIDAAKAEEARLKNTLKEAESEVIYLKEILGEAKAESMKLKENLQDKENEMQDIIEENEELRVRETESIKKVDELSKLLEESIAKTHIHDNGEISDVEKDYDMLPKVVEFSEQNGIEKEEKPMTDTPTLHCNEPLNENQHAFKDSRDDAVLNGNMKENGKKEKEDDDFKTWESLKIGEKDLSPEREKEEEDLFEEEVDVKVEGGEKSEEINGLSSNENLENGVNSPSIEQIPKKKKPLLSKFGSLLKKKGSSNHK